MEWVSYWDCRAGWNRPSFVFMLLLALCLLSLSCLLWTFDYSWSLSTLAWLCMVPGTRCLFVPSFVRVSWRRRWPQVVSFLVLCVRQHQRNSSARKTASAQRVRVFVYVACVWNVNGEWRWKTKTHWKRSAVWLYIYVLSLASVDESADNIRPNAYVYIDIEE